MVLVEPPLLLLVKVLQCSTACYFSLLSSTVSPYSRDDFIADCSCSFLQHPHLSDEGYVNPLMRVFFKEKVLTDVHFS